jgi:hypothetical protein
MNAHLSLFKLIPNFLLNKTFFQLFKVNWQVTKNYKIIKKNLHEYINIFTKSFSYCPLIGEQSIFDTKRHHNLHKSPLVYHKGNFASLLVPLISNDILKTHPKGINFMLNNYVDDLICEGQWVKVFLCCCVEFPKTTHIFNFPFFFKTITIGDSQIASTTGLIKPTIINLFIYCLTIIT